MVITRFLSLLIATFFLFFAGCGYKNLQYLDEKVRSSFNDLDQESQTKVNLIANFVEIVKSDLTNEMIEIEKGQTNSKNELLITLIEANNASMYDRKSGEHLKNLILPAILVSALEAETKLNSVESVALNADADANRALDKAAFAEAAVKAHPYVTIAAKVPETKAAALEASAALKKATDANADAFVTNAAFNEYREALNTMGFYLTKIAVITKQHPNLTTKESYQKFKKQFIINDLYWIRFELLLNLVKILKLDLSKNVTKDSKNFANALSTLIQGYHLSLQNGQAESQNILNFYLSKFTFIAERYPEITANNHFIKLKAHFEINENLIVLQQDVKAPHLKVNSLSDASLLNKYQEVQNKVNTSLFKLNATIERYPELSEKLDYKKHKEEIERRENRITVARKVYNDRVAEYNTLVTSSPTNLTAKYLLHLDKRETFEVRPSVQN